MRLGNLAGFISRPVLRGFAFGLAITIIIRQLPALIGYVPLTSDIFRLGLSILSHVAQWHVATALTGASALACLLLLRRIPSVPGPFLVLAGGIAASYVLDLSSHGVALVGAISMQPAWPEFSMRQWTDLSRVLPFTIPLVLILFAESWGTIRTLALRNNDSVEANRELGALGFANVLAAVVQGMPVGAGFSAGAASEAAGAKTRATAVVAALGLALLIGFAGNLVALLPVCVLAAVVIAALTHALDPQPILRLWRLDRDFYIALAAAAGVLAFGVLDGMLVAIALSVAALLRRLASQYTARLGQLGTTQDFVDISRHPDAREIPHIAIWRPAQPLFFANADTILTAIANATRQSKDISAVVLSLEESFDCDSTALDALLEFDTSLQAAGTRIHYARVHDNIRDLFTSAAPELAKRCSFSVADAVSTLVPAPSGAMP
jgi:MFS superfamily sulfate permease-like transporter